VADQPEDLRCVWRGLLFSFLEDGPLFWCSLSTKKPWRDRHFKEHFLGPGLSSLHALSGFLDTARSEVLDSLVAMNPLKVVHLSLETVFLSLFVSSF